MKRTDKKDISINSKSIKRTLLRGMAGLTVTVCILCGVATGVVFYITSTENMNEMVSSSATAYNHSVQNAIQTFKTGAEAIAQESGIADSSVPLATRKTAMASLAKKYGFTEIMVADSQGQTTSGTDVSSCDYFRKAIAGQTYVSSTLVTDKKVFLIVSTRSSNGSSAVICVLSSDTFSKMIADVSIGKSGYGFIVDKDGKIIAHKDQSIVTNSVNYVDKAKNDHAFASAASIVQNMKAGKTGTQAITLNGVNQCIGYTPIKDTDGWSIAVSANVNEMMGRFYTSIFITVALMLLFMAFSCVFAYKVANPIANPIRHLVKRIQLLADGDLHSEVPKVSSKDEIGVLADSFSGTVDTLNCYVGEISTVLESLAAGDCTVQTHQEYKGDFTAIEAALNTIVTNMDRILTNINYSADQVAVGASQVSGAAQTLAKGATEQESSIEELSSTVSGISAQVKENAEYATNANADVALVSSEIETSNRYMGDMVSAMSQISDSSNQIQKIIKTIEDIAFQTNILALNAAVEASRAGAAGKGFAVVADEVRNLASQSSNAANHITSLIQNSMKQVENGTRISDATAKSLLRVVESIKAVTDTVGKISQSFHQQSNAINQVTLGVDQILGVVQTNSATAEESAAASEDLSGQAQTLKELVQQFHLSN